MFSLSDSDLEKNILGCADGPASFNTELSASGGNVVSADPVYQFDSSQIRSRIEEVYPQIIAQLTKNKSDYIWGKIANIEVLAETRMDAMNKFLSDYETGKASGRHIDASLPKLPFADAEFELALCSHYLFLYSEHIDQEQHILSMRELCRVANEVRVYPLITIEKNTLSAHIEAVISDFEDSAINVELVPVEYEFQKGATEMLVAKII